MVGGARESQLAAENGEVRCAFRVGHGVRPANVRSDLGGLAGAGERAAWIVRGRSSRQVQRPHDAVGGRVDGDGVCAQVGRPGELCSSADEIPRCSVAVCRDHGLAGGYVLAGKRAIGVGCVDADLGDAV